MVLLLGIHFPDTHLLTKALQSFYGIGPQVSARILAKHHISPLQKMASLENKQVLDLTAELTGMTLENELRRQIRGNIARLRDIRAYRGMRHALGYPVRGQKTRTQTVSAKKLNKIERAN